VPEGVNVLVLGKELLLGCWCTNCLHIQPV